MSTSAKLIVEEGYTDNLSHELYDRLYFYRHYDGYPETVMPRLEALVDKIIDGKLRNSVRQFSGWIIIDGHDEYLWEDQETPGIHENWKVGAWEPWPGHHEEMDVIYTYKITLGKEPKVEMI